MKAKFKADCRPLLIGSIPMVDHEKATRLIFKYTPDIPLWVQLPLLKEEGMMEQFLPGMPCVATKGDRTFIDTASEAYDTEFLQFFEEYVAVSEDEALLETSRFALSKKTARGFYTLFDKVKQMETKPLALKGQVSGPITFCTGVTDQDKRAIFYDESLRDAGVKHLSQNAKWQVKMIAELGLPSIIFIDEPALAGFGSSEFISISRSDIIGCLEEVTSAIHEGGGLAGIHVCANTDWAMVLESGVDIVNFDAYAYFDRFILYPDQIKAFVENGGMLAWGVVPTLKSEEIEKETASSIFNAFEEKVGRIVALGIDEAVVRAQSFITPSCGTGSLSLELATKVLELTRDVSKMLRG